MILGIDSFKKHFEGFDKHYAIIGGTACDLIFNEAGAPFRATKDIDIVLIVESLNAEFGRRFWEYITNAGYEHKNKSTGNTQFYRFSHPKSAEYPFMLEIFSRNPDDFVLPEDAVLTPLPISDEVSSLSAILLNKEYYEFIKTGIMQIDGIALLDPIHLIPLKAKAWLDLSEKKALDNTSADSADIRKHKNDIYRLSTLLEPDMRVKLPNGIYSDIQMFLQGIKTDAVDLKQLGIRNQSLSVLISRIKDAYITEE